jgi:hypothetical protein
MKQKNKIRMAIIGVMILLIAGAVEGDIIKKGDSFNYLGSSAPEVSSYKRAKSSSVSSGIPPNQKMVVFDSTDDNKKIVVLYEQQDGDEPDWVATKYKEVNSDDLVPDTDTPGSFILTGHFDVRRDTLKLDNLGENDQLNVKIVDATVSTASSAGKEDQKAPKTTLERLTGVKNSEDKSKESDGGTKKSKPDLIISKKTNGYLDKFTVGGLHLVTTQDIGSKESNILGSLATYTPSGSSTKYYYLSDGKGVRLVDEASLKTMASWESDKSVKVGRLETVKIDKTKPVDEQLDDINKGFTGGGSMVSVITADMAQKADEVVKNSDYGEKPSVSFGMNSISVSKEKDGEDYLAYRAYNVNIGLDRTATGYEQNRFATVQENYDSENGKLVSKVITVHDGEVITGTLDPRGNIIECNQADCESNPFFQKIQNRDAYSYWADSLDRGAKWSKLSSLFGMDDDFAGWRQGVDELFRKTFILGGAEAWAQKICEVVTDVKEENNALFSLNEDGLMTPTASIAATKQFMQSPSGNRWIYKLSFFVRNPEASSPGNVKKYKSGVRAKSSKSLSGDERQIWNEIEGAGKDISNERARYSKTSKGEDLSFNIEFSGQRTIRLLKKDKVLGAGDEIFFMGEDSFATASSYNYDTICLVFTDNPPKNAFYDEVGSVCASIVDVTGSAPSQIVVPEKEVSDESGRGEFVVI